MATRQIFEQIAQVVPYSQMLIVSTLPRGSTYVIQPARCPESLVKTYVRDFHREDRVTWTAITRGQTVRTSDVWKESEWESSPYLWGYLNPHGLKHVVGAPLSAPLLNGYHGAVLLFRGPDEGDFTDTELGKLKNFGRDVDEFLNKGRQARNTELAANTDPWMHTAPMRQFIFGKDGKPIFPKKDLHLDPRVLEQLQQHAKEAVEYCKRGQVYADRLLLPDENGELWVFHCVVHREFPALSSGPVVFFCLQPESFEWVAVRPADVAADGEMLRLLPSLKYMQQEFRTATLNTTAERVQLSTFHFHRRFADLIGMTPKHFLASCQLHQTKRLLASFRRELAQIATDCGFAHQSHFTSRFKQTTGLTPTKWRRLAAELIYQAGGR